MMRCLLLPKLALNSKLELSQDGQLAEASILG